jgi:mycothiol synthase
VDAIMDCVLEIDKADHPHWLTPREEVEEDLGYSHVDLERDSLLAVAPNGQVQAWGLTVVSPGQETLVRSIMNGGVRPSQRGRGIGRRLFAWQNERGLEQLAASDKELPGWLFAYCEEEEKDAAALYSRFDYTIARYFLELTRTVSEPIVPRPLQEGLRLVNYSPEYAEATRASRNNSFRDHWGSQPINEELWQSFVSRSILRPDLSFLAVTTGDDGKDEVAGLVMSSVDENDWEGQGFSSAYIDLVGVAREWRGRGIAASLLTTTLEAVARAGLDRAVLDVDSDSPTGALGLYTGVGFRPERRSMCLIREF